MPLPPHHLELLAPARDLAIGLEAVNHGADAVYLGAPAFGARAAAGNSIADIAVLVRHAHRFHAKVFVTLNTLLHDAELEPARRLAWQLHESGVDALIVQDMGLLELDLPPLALHASTQCDIRSPEKARFLQDVGFDQVVLARELDLTQIAAIRAATDPQRCALEFFVHGALCVAYSGQCYISAAHTGRSANRGECNQACRLPYQVLDRQGRFVAHNKHVLSMKDNNQSANLAALVDAGVRSFKIEGRYKDMAYVKNITAHYRRLIDELLEQRQDGAQPLARASSGRVHLRFTPDPNQNFNRAFTDYFVNGRREDIGAFDSPKNPGQPLGYVLRAGPDGVDLALHDPALVLNNGDGLCYFDLQKELQGLAINRAEPLDRARGHWRVFPKDDLAMLKDLRKNTEVNRNRDVHWLAALDKKSSERRIGAWVELKVLPDSLQLTLTDAEGHRAQAQAAFAAGQRQLARDPAVALAQAKTQLDRLGASMFEAIQVDLAGCGVPDQMPVLPSSVLNALRRQAVDALERQRAAAYVRPQRASALSPPAPYPESALSYLGNVLNRKAHDFYVRHGVQLIAPGYEALQESGEVSLMITKHCVRFSLSLCPKQAKGVTGVQGWVRAEPLQLVNGREKLTLRFDCKACEMHVVGKMKPEVARQLRQAAAPAASQAVTMTFHPRQARPPRPA